jgi:predicted RNase H-like HicB family nuclease
MIMKVSIALPTPWLPVNLSLPMGPISGIMEIERERHLMTRDFSVIVERDSEGWYVASVPELSGCHTQANSLGKLMERIREAIELCLEVERAAPPQQFIGVQRISVEV